MRTGGRQFDVNDSVVNIGSRPTAPTLETQEMLRAARLLIDQNAVPEWLPEECRYDSYSDTRKLVDGSGS
jgi:hypothetical protein